MKIGGTELSPALTASWFGRVQVAAAGEEWPTYEGRPLHPLAQLNLRELPFRPEGLSDLELITVFIDPENLPDDDEPNGHRWCLRAYKNASILLPLRCPILSTHNICSLPMKPIACDADYPCREDVPEPLNSELDDDYLDACLNITGFNLGGWPTLIQSEIYWAPWNKHAITPRYVFQIDSEDKANWFWGDAGVGYFGRGTAEGHTDEWALSWQCC